ncbi:OmpA family protein [Bradyrhizobium betae]
MDRTVYTEPDRIIIRDPGGQAYVRGNDLSSLPLWRAGHPHRHRRRRNPHGRRSSRWQRDHHRCRRRRPADAAHPQGPRGREIIIIDNTYRDPRAVGGFYVDVPPPVVNMPYDRYIVDAQEASPDVIYQTMVAPPVQRIDRRYSLDEIRYSPNVRMQMPSIDVNTIVFETGSWTIPPDQAARLQVIADGLNQAIQRNPREVFLIEGHTDAVGNEVDNLSLSDRRAQAAAELLTQQFGVPAENLTSQGYGEQYLKEQTQGPSAINRRVTIRNITPLLNGGQASCRRPRPAPHRRGNGTHKRKWPGAIPAIFVLTSVARMERSAIRESIRLARHSGFRYAPSGLRETQPLSLSSRKICEPSLPESRPVLE